MYQKQNTFIASNSLQVVSYGNGAAYKISFTKDDGYWYSLFLQDEDARIFQDEWEKAENAFPDSNDDEIVDYILSFGYDEVAERENSV